jgi:hypothetical protein
MHPPKSYLDDFDPNDMPEPWATYTIARTPHFKLHRTLGAATSAMAHHKRAGIVLFERENGRWVPRARFERPHYGDPDASLLPQVCDYCRQSTRVPRQPFQSDSSAAYNAATQFLERVNGKLVKPLRVITLCGPCAGAGDYL